MSELLTIAILSGVFGSIITWFVQYILEKSKEKYKSELELKEKRYKCTMVFMEGFLNPKNLKFIQHRNPDICSKNDLKETLKVEYAEILLFAPDDVVKSLKSFIESPTEEKYFRTIQLMRKDLWGKNTNLTINDIRF
ncbi:Uncharacterised protein [uncultured archaeon]|nr:Uncharacterised protein [uncultured archaeon]